MTQAKTIFAFTPPGGNPPFLNISEIDETFYRVTVRSESHEIITDAMSGATKTVQPIAAIDITDKNQLVHMFASLGEYLYGDEIMAITGKVIFQLLTSTPPESITAAADHAVVIAEDLQSKQSGE